MEVFLCPACRFVLWDPVTVSCGHSFCKRCLGDALPSRCLLCRGRLKLLGVRAVQGNVLLGSLLEKCLDRDTKLARLQSHLQDLLRSRDYRAALRTTQKGLELGKRGGGSRVWGWWGGRLVNVWIQAPKQSEPPPVPGYVTSRQARLLVRLRRLSRYQFPVNEEPLY